MRVVSTEIKIVGQTPLVKVYYITPEFYKELSYTIGSNIPSIFKRLDHLEEKIPDYLLDRLRLLEDLLEDQIEKKLLSEIKEEISKRGLHKSFHKYDILRSMETPLYWNLKTKLFNWFLERNFIEYRGSGWYRRKTK